MSLNLYLAGDNALTGPSLTKIILDGGAHIVMVIIIGIIRAGDLGIVRTGDSEWKRIMSLKRSQRVQSQIWLQTGRLLDYVLLVL